MNSVRSLIILISRIPPAMLLALIVGIAGVTTMLVTGEAERNKIAYEKHVADLDAKAKATGTVVIALKDVPEGATVPSEALEEKRISVGNIPTDALTTASMASGRITKYGITAGQIVSQHDLAPIGISIGFESRLKPGMRAITFGVDTNSGVAGFINPESRVDVMSMVGTGSETKVAPILSDVEVIAVGQMYQKQPGGQAVPASSVTVAVSPLDAQKLVKGVAASKIYLSLRSQSDRTPVVTVDVVSLFPKKETDGNQIANAADLVGPPPSSIPLPSPPSMEENAFAPGEPQASALPISKRSHEIEMWNGGAKQVVEMPSNI
jgi:pilus assembly protein CpaB